MLIEAAISTAVFEALEEAADEVAALSERLRHEAEHYDTAETSSNSASRGVPYFSASERRRRS